MSDDIGTNSSVSYDGSDGMVGSIWISVGLFGGGGTMLSVFVLVCLKGMCIDPKRFAGRLGDVLESCRYKVDESILRFVTGD